MKTGIAGREEGLQVEKQELRVEKQGLRGITTELGKMEVYRSKRASPVTLDLSCFLIFYYGIQEKKESP